MSQVLILHNAVACQDSLADQDVLLQAEQVEAAAKSLGHIVDRLPVTLDLASLQRKLIAKKPDVVFNLVEALGGSDRLGYLVPSLLEVLNIPFTGASSLSFWLTASKVEVKRRLRSVGLPTPNWVELHSHSSPARTVDRLAPPYIIKAIYEHASVGIDATSVVTMGAPEEVLANVSGRCQVLGQRCFAEQFIAGREFNLSILAGPNGPQVLPAAEIDFSQIQNLHEQIVGYAAKWEAGSFEFDNTPRRFEFPAADGPLLSRLQGLAIACWHLFAVKGYARVDFRVDQQGQPWILEINTNPCLSSDAGFAAAVGQAGLKFEAAVERIIDDALTGTSTASVLPKKAAPPLGAEPFVWREAPIASDALAIRRIVEATNMFRPGETDVAVELLDERLENGPESGYEFIFADDASLPAGEQVVGYVCFGLNAMTVASYDLYWICVDPQRQGQKIGQLLMAAVENRVRKLGGQRIYLETSGRPDYAPTRGFYDRCGYHVQAFLPNYYAPADDKLTYVKEL